MGALSCVGASAPGSALVFTCVRRSITEGSTNQVAVNDGERAALAVVSRTA